MSIDQQLGRRDAILAAAAREFERVGFASATIAAIARGAGISQGSLHFHFRTKVAIALGVIDEQNVRTFRVVNLADSSPTAALIAATGHFGDLLLTDPVVRAGIRLSLEHGEFAGTTSASYDRWIAGIVDVFRLALASGELRTDLTAEQLGATVVPYFTGVQLVSDVRTGRQDLYAALTTMWHVLLTAIADPAHRARLFAVVASTFDERTAPDGS
ncbi:TetR/AcrR family transcriptional regulator [Curtobacterium sp. ISL-83]|uniref:TetR/AcrR family transcriptional regulator n=1 Tax=Curtobacterium sp. ISL-83 TaxID=2819145 RepID=UPI001BEBCB7F|nr:TetR/AcrR family transcriptional regulator [Curtobacterium sp. ISL-83]MBT2503672.1 TetR/AcrR family transcriptional regulator [Curtobacterium sp. ISL-83]